jgi:dipeptidyl aminopeptidase/acylaminoacyl peptidase
MSSSLIPRAHLFGNPSRAAAQISPDGRWLSWLAPADGVLNVWVAPLDAPHDAHPITRERARGVTSYCWTCDERCLLYLQDVGGNENFQLFAVDPVTCIERELTPFPAVAARIQRISRHVRDRVLVALNRRDVRFHDLHVLDLASGALTLVEENTGFASYVTDDRYGVRLAVRLAPDGGREILRRDGGDWERWLRFDPADASVSSSGHLDRAGTSLFLRDSRGRETAALVRIDLASGATTLLAEDDRADIGGVLTDIETLEPIAYSVTTERVRYAALVPHIEFDLDFLRRQDIGDWAVQSRTEADDIWVVTAQSDTRPGIAYIYDRRAGTLRELYRGRPELHGAPLAAMRPVTIRSRDGLDLVSYLTLPNDARPGVPCPMVLLVHGGPWSRDQFGFQPRHQWLANRGYAVLSVNFRGSTGFGKRFVDAGNREWGRRMDDDLLDGVAWAIEQKIADPRRIAIMGWSYGGYATLVGLTRNPDVYACGIDVVGPSNLETLLRTIPPYWEAIRAQLCNAIGDPDTEDGRRLAHERSPLFQAHRIAKPLLIAQGANDPRVKQAESDRMVEALEANGIPVTYALFPDEGHGFGRPENSIAFCATAEAFLARHLGGRAEPIRPEEIAASTMQIREGVPAPTPSPAGAGPG